jgi:hypothetical protein
MYPQCTVISSVHVYRFCTLRVSNVKSYVPRKNFDVVFLAYNGLSEQTTLHVLQTTRWRCISVQNIYSRTLSVSVLLRFSD